MRDTDKNCLFASSTRRGRRRKKGISDDIKRQILDKAGLMFRKMKIGGRVSSARPAQKRRPKQGDARAKMGMPEGR